MHDIVIEALSGTRVTVLSPSDHDLDEELIIHVSTGDGLQSRRATVISSVPTSSAGALEYRLELSVAAADEEV